MNRGLALLLSAALATGTLVTASGMAQAARAPRELGKKTFTVMGTLSGRAIVPSGNAQGIGNLMVTTGKLSDTAGAAAGSLTTVMRVVAPGGKSDSELRDTQSQIALKDGTVFAQAVNEDPKGKAAETLHIFPVIGGTGAYATARGTLIMYPMGKQYRMAYDFFVDKKLTTSTKAFGVPQVVTVDDTTHKGISGVTMRYAVGDDSISYLVAATRIGSGVDSSDIRVDLPTGTLFGRGIVPSSGKTQTYAVLGGTKAYAGYRGELQLSASGRGITLRLAAPSGNSKAVTWSETVQKAFSSPLPTGSFASALGKLSTPKGLESKGGGTFESGTVTYPSIAGLTPVVAMTEETFVTCTLLITGMLLSPSEPLPAVGGTGDCGGASGSVTAKTVSASRIDRSAAFWR